MQKIINILSEIRPEFDFRASEDYLLEGMLDSLDIVTLVAELDKVYGISIRGVDIVPENFRNLISIASLLRANGVEP